MTGRIRVTLEQKAGKQLKQGIGQHNPSHVKKKKVMASSHK